MIRRTYSVMDIYQATEQYAEEITGFEPKTWVEDNLNVALINHNNDVALFERQFGQPKTVWGHYFFHSRGKDARDEARNFLTEIFTGSYDVEMILGLTPTEHKGACWLNRQLKFQTLSELETVAGPAFLVMLSKQMWENTNNG